MVWGRGIRCERKWASGGNLFGVSRMNTPLASVEYAQAAINKIAEYQMREGRLILVRKPYKSNRMKILRPQEVRPKAPFGDELHSRFFSLLRHGMFVPG
jgi:hypothetical protein